MTEVVKSAGRRTRNARHHCKVGVAGDGKIKDLKKWKMEENATRQTHKNNSTGLCRMVVSKEVKLPWKRRYELGHW